MATILTFPTKSEDIKTTSTRYTDRIKTAGDHWVQMEKRLIDKAEFLEAMVLVLDDVKLTNIRNRDYGMMDIVSQEIPQYQSRLEEVQKSLLELRKQYADSASTSKIIAN